MHEWALAEGVVSAASRLAEEEGLAEIIEVAIRIGELQQIDHEVFLFALEQQRTPIMKNARFVIESIKGRFRCRACGNEWAFDPEALGEDVSEAVHFVPEMAHVFIKCSRCGSPDFEVVEGRGVWLASIRGVKRDG